MGTAPAGCGRTFRTPFNKAMLCDVQCMLRRLSGPSEVCLGAKRATTKVFHEARRTICVVAADGPHGHLASILTRRWMLDRPDTIVRTAAFHSYCSKMLHFQS